MLGPDTVKARGDPGLFYRVDAVTKPGGGLYFLGSQVQGFQITAFAGIIEARSDEDREKI